MNPRLLSLPFAALALPAIAVAQNGGAAQPSSGPDAVPWITPETAQLDLSWFEPVRAEYQRITFPEGEPQVQLNRTILTLDLVVAEESRPGLLLQWLGVSSSGSGTDTAVLDLHTLAVRRRVAPAGDGAINIAVHEEGAVRVSFNDFAGDVFKQESLEVEHGAFDHMALPYTLAAMDLDVGDRFAMPLHSPFAHRYNNLHIHVASTEPYELPDGRTIEALRVEYYNKPTREEACTLIDMEAERGVVSNLISRQAPYWLEQRIEPRAKDSKAARQTLRVVNWTTLNVGASTLDQLLKRRVEH